jgi:hypothetical protein
MATPLHAYPRAKRRARRRGRSHGRQGLPNHEWAGGPVPYLETLHSSYGQQIEQLDQKLRIVEGQSITSNEEDVADKQSQEYQILQCEQERSMYESQLTKLLEEKIGEANENPTGKAARHRHIPIWVYFSALFALAIGEFFVTLPAVELLLNDVPWKAYIITASLAILSIIAAHIIGLTFKIAIDRDRPQPGAQRWGAGILGGFIALVVLMLSSLRSGSISGVPVKLGLPDDRAFGTVLFFLIQMTFILCAVALSYYNHSENESDISRTKRKIKQLTKKIRGLTRSRLIPSRGNLTPEKRVVQEKAIITHMRLLEAEYRELCSIYRGANLLAQKVSFNNPGAGLTEKPLAIPTHRFAEEAHE